MKDKRTITLAECQNIISRTLICKSQQILYEIVAKLKHCVNTGCKKRKYFHFQNLFQESLLQKKSDKQDNFIIQKFIVKKVLKGMF